MEGSHGLLGDGLDGNWMNILVPEGFQQRLSIRAVGFVSSDVLGSEMGGQKNDLMPQGDELSSPVVRTAAGLEEYEGRRLLGEEALEPDARKAVPFANAPWPVGNSDLEHGLCEIDRDGSTLHLGLLLKETSLSDVGPAASCQTSRRRSPYHHLEVAGQGTAGISTALR